ncbi:DUF1569 domain-containing protein [Ferruginibacter sp.]
MKTVLDTATRAELISRISSLTDEHKAQWGKMNVYQMSIHCILCDDMFWGNLAVKRVFIGRLIGRMLLRNALKENADFGKGAPTSPLLLTTSKSGDIEEQKKIWISKVGEYAHYDNHHFVHPFFGPMTLEQIGIFAYKHTDHHLRQFGA